MKRFLLALLLLGGITTSVFADAIPDAVSNETHAVWKQTVFNDSGGTLSSGAVVVWDNDDTEFDRSGYRYVTTTTTADFVWTAGVVSTASCPDQTLCEIIVRGPAKTQVADSTDALVEDTLVGTSTVAGKAGDYTAAANSCSLGRSMELRGVDSGQDVGTDNQVFWVDVLVTCQ